MTGEWTVWSWDARHGIWMAVGDGAEAEMTTVLDRQRAAAAKHLPSARFTMTRTVDPPTEPPDDEARAAAPTFPASKVRITRVYIVDCDVCAQRASDDEFYVDRAEAEEQRQMHIDWHRREG